MNDAYSKRPWLESYPDNVPHNIDFPKSSLSHLLSDAVQTNPSGIAATYFGKKITYAELAALVKQFALALTRLGVKKGDRVAIMLPNIPQYLICHFGVLRIGAILVPTNPLYKERELKHQMKNSGARVVITLDFLFPRIAAVRAETDIKNIIVTRVSEYLPWHLKMLYPLKAKKDGTWTKVGRAPGVHFFKELMSEEFTIELSTPEPGAEDIAVFLYTGGTTGLSKGAVLSHRNLVSNVIQNRVWLPDVVEGREVVVGALPFFHSYGLTTCLHMAVLLKSTLLLIPDPRDIKALLGAIQKEKATLFSGVPTLYVAINNFPGVEKYDLSSIKGCVSGGAPLPLEVARQFEKISAGKLVEGYGLSETSPVTHANPFNGLRKEGSIGIPLPGTEARVVDPDTQKAVPVGEIGELAVRGPQVMRGYWQMEEESKLVFQDGWLFTGDIARMDEDGYFFIVDRKKDIIIAGGFNIYPREIEEVLYEHPKILEAAVTGLLDEYRGETVKAFIVCKDGESLKADEILSFCKERLASFKVPKQIEFRDSLPKSNIGKVLRRVLRDEAVGMNS